MANPDFNPWKVATIGLAVVVTTVVVTTLVVGNWKSQEAVVPATGSPERSPAQASPPRPPRAPRAAAVPQQSPPLAGQAAPRPSSTDIQACNQYARSVTTNDTTTDVLTKAVIGGAVGAGVGAAGGAIAGGGKGAGKGAAIGGIVGATAGTLYGLNEANRQDSRSVEAYRRCMRERGHTG